MDVIQQFEVLYSSPNISKIYGVHSLHNKYDQHSNNHGKTYYAITNVTLKAFITLH